MSATTAETAEVLCKRFGPGRLPGADNRDIGAGYAFATAALSAATVFVVVTGFEPITTYGLGAFGPAHGGIYMFGAYAIPFVVPSAFVAGAFTWAQRPASARYWGVVGGIVATVLTYIIATPLTVSGWYVITLLHPEWTMSGNLLRLMGLFGMFGFLLTCWLTLPVGAISGHIHERAVADATTDGPDAATDGLGNTDEHGLQADEQVERLLLRNGGRMTGADIVEATGWSEAEVAEAVSILAAADRVERRHEDGDTVICYPEE